MTEEQFQDPIARKASELYLKTHLNPLSICCANCGAAPGTLCPGLELTFHNERILDAGMTLREHFREAVARIPGGL